MNFLKFKMALVSCTLFITYSYSQNIGTAVFTNGDSINFMYIDDPLKIPKHSFGISPFGPGPDYIGFKLHGYANLSSRFSIRAKVHGIYTDFGNDFDKKLPLDILQFGEYKFYQKRVEKEQRVKLKSELNTVWFSEIPLHKRRTLGVAAGFAYNSYADGVNFSSSEYGTTYSGDGIPYYTTDVGYYGVALGFTYEAAMSYYLRSEELTKVTCGYKTKRFYAFIAQTVPGDVKTYSYQAGLVEVDHPFNYEFTTFYFRLGWEAEYGFNNSNLGIIVGTEVGTNPYHRVNYDGAFSQGTEPLFHFTLGLSIGQNPWSTKSKGGI